MASSMPLMPDALESYRQQVHSALIAMMPQSEARLVEVCQYALGAPGKMLRALLLLEACSAVGGDPNQALLAAAGTEYGHLASLIHDDLIDGDELRRGRESIWKRFGRDNAILSGDLLIFQAFLCLSRCGADSQRVVQALEVMSRCCIDLCLGQDLEFTAIRNLEVGVNTYLQIIQQKTGALFRASVEIGGILGGGTPAQVEALAAYGDALGLAFQIADDVLSYRGSAAELGKPVLSDLRNGRVTLPVLIAHQRSAGSDRTFLEALFSAAAEEIDYEIAFSRLVRVMQETEALQVAIEMARAEAAASRRHLQILPASHARSALELAITLVTERMR